MDGRSGRVASDSCPAAFGTTLPDQQLLCRNDKWQQSAGQRPPAPSKGCGGTLQTDYYRLNPTHKRHSWRSWSCGRSLCEAGSPTHIGHGPLLFSFVRRLPLPRGDEDPPQVGGQALDKARGRKPRDEARPFSRGVALWAFERRPIAQVRDVRGAAPGAACCVKALPALGCAGEVRAARLVM